MKKYNEHTFYKRCGGLVSIKSSNNSMVCVKFPIRAGTAWELWSKPSRFERGGIYVGRNSDKIF